MMRHYLLFTFTLLFLNACVQTRKSKLTVIIFDNQNPNAEVTIDTLLKEKYLNFSERSIDLFFASKNFHLPYYVPTDGIFRNAGKDKECDMKIYPGTVKCYEYDEKKRVVRMTVNGSGTMTNFYYRYNDKDQVIEITDGGTHYMLQYNADERLSQLTQSDGAAKKKLLFIYD